jgi:hypothetical protein
MVANSPITVDLDHRAHHLRVLRVKQSVLPPTVREQ